MGKVAAYQSGSKWSLEYFTRFQVIPPLLNRKNPADKAVATMRPESGASRKYWSRDALDEKYACVASTNAHIPPAAIASVPSVVAMAAARSAKGPRKYASVSAQ